MPTYAYRCLKCTFVHDGEMFNTFKDFQNHKCPKCGSKVEQVFTAINFKINGYSHNNEYKGKSYYRDIGKEKRRTYSHAKNSS